MNTSGAGLPRGTSSDETVTSKCLARSARPRTASITARFDEDATASRKARARRCTAATAPSMSGSSSVVPVEQPTDDLVADLLRRLREADHVVHIARPFERAHPHHVRLCLVVPAPVALARELLSNLAPHVLRVDQHAVQVEDDCVDVPIHA